MIGFFHFSERTAAIGTIIIIGKTTKVGTPIRNLKAPQDHNQTRTIIAETIRRKVRALADKHNWSDSIFETLLK